MIGARMSSPIGHALAGIAVAWAADLIPGDRAWRTAPAAAPWYLRAGDGLTLLCAGLGAAPDVDLLFVAHRTVTHSIGAVLFVGLFAALGARLWSPYRPPGSPASRGTICEFGPFTASARRPIARTALMCAAAYASHLLVDWLGADSYPPLGIQALWPITREWYISGTDVFRQTERFHIFTRPAIMTNLRAIVQEMAILGPIVVALWLVRVKALAGLAPQLARRDHPAQ